MIVLTSDQLRAAQYASPEQRPYLLQISGGTLSEASIGSFLALARTVGIQLHVRDQNPEEAAPQTIPDSMKVGLPLPCHHFYLSEISPTFFDRDSERKINPDSASLCLKRTGTFIEREITFSPVCVYVILFLPTFIYRPGCGRPGSQRSRFFFTNTRDESAQFCF